MARIDNLNAHIKKTHGGLTWQEAVARSAAIVAAQQLPTIADSHAPQHQTIAAYELSANGDCLELKTVVADCFKAGGSGVVVLGGGSGGVADFKLLGSPPSPSGSWMT